MDISSLTKLTNKDKVNDLRGWVDTIRHHGGLMFFELRDHETKVQIVTDTPDKFDNVKNECQDFLSIYYKLNSYFYKIRDKIVILKQTKLSKSL